MTEDLVPDRDYNENRWDEGTHACFTQESELLSYLTPSLPMTHSLSFHLASLPAHGLWPEPITVPDKHKLVTTANVMFFVNLFMFLIDLLMID